MRIITICLLRVLFTLKVEGEQNIPADEGVIVACNHSSYLDILVIASTMKPFPWFLGKKELFFEPFRTLFSNMSWISVNRGGVDRTALKSVDLRLKNNDLVVVFPEGTRNNGKEFLKPKAGIGMMVCRSNVRVVPVYLEGTSDVLPKGSLLPKFSCNIRVVYGKPVSYEKMLSDDTVKKKSLLYKNISESIMDEIRGLI